MQKVVLRDTQMRLPTTAKLFGALGLAATGFFVANLLQPYLPAAMRVHGLALVASSFGLLLGWRVIGMNPGKGLTKAIGRGLSASVYLVIWTVLFLGAVEMMHQMALNHYDAPMDALVDVLGQGLKLGLLALQWDVMAVLFCGGMLSAMLAEWAWKRWQ